MRRRVLAAAVARFRGVRSSRLQVDFEHGQWWVTLLDSGAQYGVHDAEGGDSIDGFSFEQVTRGEDE